MWFTVSFLRYISLFREVCTLFLVSFTYFAPVSCMTSPSHDRSVVLLVTVHSKVLCYCRVGRREASQFSISHVSMTSDGKVRPPRLVVWSSCSDDDDRDISPDCVAHIFHLGAMDGAFCSSIVQDILPVLVQALEGKGGSCFSCQCL